MQDIGNEAAKKKVKVDSGFGKLIWIQMNSDSATLKER